MKRITTIAAIACSLAIFSNAVTALPVYAAGSITNQYPSSDCYLWWNGSYVFNGVVSAPTTKIEVSYLSRTGWNNNNMRHTPVATLNENSSSTTYSMSFSPVSLFDFFPYPYFFNSGTQYGPFMIFHAYFADHSQNYYYLKCSIIVNQRSYYESTDSTFYYYTSTYNSFRNTATGHIEDVPYAYNCAAYAFDRKENGWLWPPCFNVSNNVANVNSYVMNTLGYSWNMTVDHLYADVISYGTSTHVEHFAKVVTWDTNGKPLEIESKWGPLEVVKSNDIDPFGSNGAGYGHPLRYFNAP